jgi:hypothetical protein
MKQKLKDKEAKIQNIAKEASLLKEPANHHL